MPVRTESERIEALKSLDILNTEPEIFYDDITALAARLCGTSAALLSVIDRDRQWVKARTGSTFTEVPRENSFCSHTIEQDSPLFQLSDLRADKRFVDHPLVMAGTLGFYAGAQVRAPGGVPIGSLCVLDARPRQLSAEQEATLLILARVVERAFEARKTIRTLRAARENDKTLAGYLVHDVKNSLAVVISSAEHLRSLDSGVDTAESAVIADDILSAAQLCLERITRSLDAASPTERETEVDLRALLTNLAREYRFKAAAHNQRIALEVGTTAVVIRTMGGTLRRIIENLLVNAFAHSPSGATTTLELRMSGESEVSIAVTDQGAGIAPGAREKIFEPGERLDSKSEGHGLGLAATKHAVERIGGSILIEDALPTGSRFVIQVPRGGMSYNGRAVSPGPP